MKTPKTQAYNVCMDDHYIRDAQMFDTDGLTDDELTKTDPYDEDSEDRWHDIAPIHLVGCVQAASEEEAVSVLAAQKRYDPRVLYADPVPEAPAKLYVANAEVKRTVQANPGGFYTVGVVLAASEDEAKAKLEAKLPELFANFLHATPRTIAVEDIHVRPAGDEGFSPGAAFKLHFILC